MSERLDPLPSIFAPRCWLLAALVALGSMLPHAVTADVSSPTMSIPRSLRGGDGSPIYLNVVTRQGAERFVLRHRAPLLHGPVYENGKVSKRRWDDVLLFEGVARERGPRKGLRPRQVRGDVIGDRLRLFFSGRRNGRLFVLKTTNLGNMSTARISGVPRSKRISCAHESAHSAALQQGGSSAHLSAALPATGTVTLFTPPMVVELGIDGDFEFFQRYGSGSLAQMLAIVNAAEAPYTDQMGVSFKVVSSNISTNPSDPSASKDAETLLDQYNSYTIGFTGRTADLFHLFTGKEPITFGSEVVVGLAGSPNGPGEPGPLCVDPGNSFGFSGPVNESLTGILTAHEIGHNLGATHPDEDFPSLTLPASIMSSFIEPSGNKFSEYSRSQIAKQIIDHPSCVKAEAKYLTFSAKVTAGQFEATFSPTSAMGSGCKTSIYASKRKADLQARLTGGKKLILTSVKKGKKKTVKGTVKNSQSSTKFYVRSVTDCKTADGVKNYQGSPILTLKARDKDPITRLKNSLK